VTDWLAVPTFIKAKKNAKQGTRVTTDETAKGANGDGAHYTDGIQFNGNDEWAQDGFQLMITVVSDSWRAAQTRSQHAVN